MEWRPAGPAMHTREIGHTINKIGTQHEFEDKDTSKDYQDHQGYLEGTCVSGKVVAAAQRWPSDVAAADKVDGAIAVAAVDKDNH